MSEPSNHDTIAQLAVVLQEANRHIEAIFDNPRGADPGSLGRAWAFADKVQEQILKLSDNTPKT